MPTQHPKVGSSGSYCWDVSFPAARIFWGWTSHLLAFSARRHWTPHRMPSSKSWSIAVSQLRTVDPSLSQEMWLAVMLSWTAEESMMSKKQFSRHSSPTGARTRGGASTMNTITVCPAWSDHLHYNSTCRSIIPLPTRTSRVHLLRTTNTTTPYHSWVSLQPQLHHQTTSNHTHNQTFFDTWKIILQRHGLLLRLHGAIWMYNRRFDVATRFHLPQKTWSLRHSDLFFIMRHPVTFPPLQL